MRSLAKPSFDPMETIDACVAEVTDTAARTRYETNLHELDVLFSLFDSKSSTGDWHSLPRAFYAQPDQLIAGQLTKADLTALYTKYMVGKSGGSRDIYDKILISSAEICPFCGGLGQVKSLDHYLPKAYYPAYSVLPGNLIPCCRDCNTGKQAAVADQPADHFINPYFDNAKFFNERWIVGELLPNYPLAINFNVRPPSSWALVDQQRAVNHFRSYNLGRRFRLQAGAELAKIVEVRKATLRILPNEQYRAYLLDHANCNSQDLNGWSRTMYAALAENDWFVSSAH